MSFELKLNVKSYLKDWLINNGGPSILLQIERDHNKGKVVDSDLVSKLLGMQDIKKLLSYMDQFDPQPRKEKELEHLLHYFKETCIDQFFPRLIAIGFRAGIPEWDEKMKPFRELYSYLLSEEYAYVIMTSRFFLMAGYFHHEVIHAVKERINLLYQSAEERVFTIFQDREKLPKTPKSWESKGIIKDELNPWLKEKPLPVTMILLPWLIFQRDILIEIRRRK